MRRDEQRLDLVPDERDARAGRAAGAASRRRPGPRPRPSGRPSRRRRAPAGAASRPRVVESSPTPTAGWAASHGSSAAMPSPAWTSIRAGSVIAAASAVGRSPGSIGRGPRAARPVAGRVGRRRRRRAAGLGTASKSSESWSPPPSAGGRTRARPSPSRRRAGPATRAAGTDPSVATPRSASAASPADSPVIAGRRSMSVRNSYSRNSRMTVSRS